MKGIELLEQNPNTAKLICSYYLEMMIESLKHEGLPEDFKESIREEGIDNSNVGAILDGNPRNLFDFFDKHGIFINISTTNNGKSYQCDVSRDLKGQSQGANTRKEADLKGVILAIEMLEEELTKSVIDKENS
jgi:hypothetical protein